jgi:protease IV
MFAVLNWMWSIVKSVLNGIAKVAVFLVVLLLVLITVGLIEGDGLDDQMVLELDLRHAMDDKAEPTLFDLPAENPAVMDVVLGLDAAGHDPRVKGVLLRVGTGGLAIPAAEEIHAALKRFQSTGKFVIAHAQSFETDSLGDYLVASGADQIWMQPASSFFPSGTATTTVFLKGLFDKLNAVPQFIQRDEFKSAADVYTQTDYTPAFREATTRVLQSWYDNAVRTSAASRKLDPAAFIRFLQASPATTDEMKAAGLITAIGYDDDARVAARDRAGPDARITEFEEYFAAVRNTVSMGGTNTIAFIHAAGEIVEGEDDISAFGGDNVVAGDTFAKAIRNAVEDETVKAILVRIDSPGGSALASDQILDALRKARAAGKPVVVSMGSLAASGGYYIALAADRIVAEPGTLTGSIGVVYGKVAIGRSLELAGLQGREIGIGNNALILSGLEPWTDAQLAEIRQQADVIYTDFTRKVAQGRHLPIERVHEIARGRVWTGADARERGLVDKLGGFWTAVQDVKQLAGMDPKARVPFRIYPARKGFFGNLERFFEASAATVRAMQGIRALMRTPAIRAVIRAADEAPSGRAEMRATGLPETAPAP